MDWVATGKKEEAEYYFTIVDNESVMSRVEANRVGCGAGQTDSRVSPQVQKAMCNAIVSDTGGAVEYNKVL